MADFREEYAAKLRARLVAALAAAEHGAAPRDVVDKLTQAIEELDERSDLKPGWAALDAYRMWRMGTFDPSGSSSPPTGSSAPT